MNILLVVVFDNSSAAEAGTRVLHRLHDEGAITLYAMDVIAKDAAGKVTSVETPPVALFGSGAGAGLAVGTLVGLIAGPFGAAIGAGVGTLLGAIHDFWLLGVDDEFVASARTALAPGKVAIVAEADEAWAESVNEHMTAVGGVVLRRTRRAVTEDHVERDIAAFRQRIANFETDAQHAGAALAADASHAMDDVEDVLAHVGRNAGRMKLDADAKVGTLTAQLATAKEGARADLERRLARVRDAVEERNRKLAKAWQRMKDALSA